MPRKYDPFEGLEVIEEADPFAGLEIAEIPSVKLIPLGASRGITAIPKPRRPEPSIRARRPSDEPFLKEPEQGYLELAVKSMGTGIASLGQTAAVGLRLI